MDPTTCTSSGGRVRASRARSESQKPPVKTPKETRKNSNNVFTPLGGIEKVLEYRPGSDGRVELRRVTASAEGPIEHVQVRIRNKERERERKMLFATMYGSFPPRSLSQHHPLFPLPHQSALNLGWNSTEEGPHGVPTPPRRPACDYAARRR